VRSENVGIPLREHIDAGRLLVRQIDPGEIAPGEFAQQVREVVLERSLRVVIVDSVIGYFAAMGSADVLLSQLHELMTFLTRKGVLMVLCGAQESFMSIGRQQAVDVSYLSDAILVLRFFEAQGQIRRALAVVKKKHGPHASTIHELFLDDGQIRVGAEPLRELSNLMVPSTCFDASPGPPE
jgi:circadian clock protein KaiC